MRSGPARRAAAVAVSVLLAACAGDRPADPAAGRRTAPTAVVAARGATVPVRTADADAADDPAIWRNVRDPQASLLVGTDKKAGLYVYGVDGKVRHFVDAGAMNNVDLLEDVPFADGPGVLVAASDRNDATQARVALFRLDTGAERLLPLGTVAAGAGEAYGLCLYGDGESAHAVSVLKDGTVNDLRLALGTGTPSATIVRTFRLASQAEGCVVDHRSLRLYVAEERAGLWRIDLGAGTAPVLVLPVDGQRLLADAEGVTLLPEGADGGYVIVSSQGDDAFALVGLPEERYVGRFRITAGVTGGVEETDGIAVATGDFGPRFPGGLFVAQDGRNGREAQDFKLVAWDDVRAALGLAARDWLAGDHHVHSEFSADYVVDPAHPEAMPSPVFGADARYPVERNAREARAHGLDWMVSTDHGGPGHSRIDHDLAHPALERSRAAVPDLVQFFGMEFDTPGGDHSSLIVPAGADERARLREIEAGFSARDAHPRDPARDAEPRMLEALEAMDRQPLPPVLIANHPSRSASSEGGYGRYEPREFRDWNDRAPRVAVGMEGAPGHQASALRADGSLDAAGRRGGYRAVPTRGGFDPMTARLGGLWDSLLGEGRRWWITATSDSHEHWRDGGNDFWPGEYSRTYVHARRDAADLLDGLRGGRVFVATGGLVDAVRMTVTRAGGWGAPTVATLGGTLVVAPGAAVDVQVSVRDPAVANAAGRNPQLHHLDLVAGDVGGPASDRRLDLNPTTRVLRRFTAADWRRDGEWLHVAHRLEAVDRPLYLRLRGTDTTQDEPAPDPAGEDPWSDLWFYANPVFIEPRPALR